MTSSSPGKAYRGGISIFQLQRMFPDEGAATEWFEGILWSDGERFCPRCGTDNNYRPEKPNPKMPPYRCRDCKSYFSVRTGTVIERSQVPLLKWLYAIYLDTTSLKGISSMKLHRDIGVSQKTAWFMLQRIREAFSAQGPPVEFLGPVEVDETYIGGRRKNMPKSRREKLNPWSNEEKSVVVGVKDRATKQVRAKVVKNKSGAELRSVVEENVAPGAAVFTDEAGAYRKLDERGYRHERVNHSVGEYVDGHVHTNSIESFWSMLKRAHKGVFHKLSPKHLQRYVDEFAGRANMRELDTAEQMATVVAAMAAKRLTYSRLIEDNGLASGARPPREPSKGRRHESGSASVSI